ncbi:MAG: SRPBCC domain-containing protein [Acidobacteriota bacterium]
MFRKEIRTEIDILASADVIWEILTDFPSYKKWNPFILYARGELEEGSHFEVYLQPPGRKGMTFKPVWTAVDPPNELRWLEFLGPPGLLDGEHYFLLEEKGAGVIRFVQGEIFKGVLVPFLPNSLKKGTLRGFRDMNRALKKKAETVKSQMDTE